MRTVKVSLCRPNSSELPSGRRVLKSYLLLFIHSSSALKPDHDYEYILERALNTYVLGEFVGPQWQLGKVMKWTPATQSETVAGDPMSVVQLGREASRSIGLYKVEGTAVEAVVGGVFHQFVSDRIHPGLRRRPTLQLGRALTKVVLLGWTSCAQALPYAITAAHSATRQARRLARLFPCRCHKNLRADGRIPG